MTFLFPQASKSCYGAAQSEWGQKIPVLYELFQVLEHIKPKTAIYKTSLTMLLNIKKIVQEKKKRTIGLSHLLTIDVIY